MKDPDTEESRLQRASQEDPIVMYLIVRESLNMGMGKTAAQCAHASQMLQIKFNEIENNYNNQVKGSGSDYLIFKEWLNSSFRKVVLKADEREWKKLKEELTCTMVSIIDAGLTEVEPNTNTVIGLFPMYRSKCPKIIKRLQALK